MAFDRLLTVVSQPSASTDRNIARAITRLADSLSIGRQERTLTLGFRGEPPRAMIDVNVSSRMRAIAHSAALEHDELLVGELFEADFEANTARLRPQIGIPVTVEFQDDQADAIYQALRRPARLYGSVSYDPSTMQARRIDLHELASPMAQMAIGGQSDDTFWRHRSVSELAAQQGISGPQDLESLHAGIPPTPEEIEAFFSAVDE
jgi:hypothetical protein